MAFQKTITLPSGASGNYIRLISYRADRATLDASVIFALYLDAAHSENGAPPLAPVVAKMRLTGTKFTEYLGTAALEDMSVMRMLYLAARVEPVIAGAGLTLVVFSDALDV